MNVCYLCSRRSVRLLSPALLLLLCPYQCAAVMFYHTSVGSAVHMLCPYAVCSSDVHTQCAAVLSICFVHTNVQQCIIPVCSSDVHTLCPYARLERYSNYSTAGAACASGCSAPCSSALFLTHTVCMPHHQSTGGSAFWCGERTLK